MSKKTDTIELQTSSALHSCNLTDVDLKQNLIPVQWKLKCIILAVQQLSELVYVLCTKTRSGIIPMGIHRNEICS